MDKKVSENEINCIKKILFTKTIAIIFLLSHPGAYLILKILGAALTRRQRFKEGGAFFKVKKKKVKFQHFTTVSKKVKM